MSSDLAVFLAVLAARLLVPLAIPRFPLPANIAALVLDGIDQSIFQIFTNLPLDDYQSYDKALDIFYLSVAYLSTMRNWSNLIAFDMSRFLYYFRMVGVLFFELTQARALLLLFPNTFEYFFIFYQSVALRWNPRRLTAAMVIGAAFAIWVFIKVPQEYWIHVAQRDVTDTIKMGFGVPLDTSWGTIVSQNLLVFLVLAVAVLAVIFALRWLVITRLPAADWALSFNADTHERDVTPQEAQAVARTRARTLLDSDLFEKIALIALVTVIFSRTLPGVDATLTQLAIGAAVIIAVNTAISEWLLRHRFTWGPILLEFVVMMAANGIILALAAFALPFVGGSIDRGSTLFLLLLLTLLIIMYDDFRPYYLARRDRQRNSGSVSHQT